MKKTHFILSVGISIIENYADFYSRNDLSALMLPVDLARDETGRLLDPLDEPGCLLSTYSRYRGNFHESDVRGAEETSIETIRASGHVRPDSPLCFHLISTKTAECLFCTSFLGHEVLKPLGEVRYYIPHGLESAEDDSFSTRGLPNLLACLASILNEVESAGDHAILIPTGGYKAVIPYLTIASILYGKPAHYIYEKSTNLLTLPAPPLGIDAASFRAAVVLLDNIVGLSEAEAEPYFSELDETFQSLVRINNKSLYEYNAFGRRLKKMFEQTSRSPLIDRAVGNKLIPKLDEKYMSQFLDLTQAGETVWLGDKAPEMADHARYHHLNLFAYTELLLLPILNGTPGFLSGAELFLLLGMVYLHDCGHSLCSVRNAATGDTQPLLPTEIRNFHNLLGFRRLQDPAFRESLKRQGLDLDEELLKAVATLAVYHRKKMPLLKNRYAGPEGSHRPLCEETVAFDGSTIEGNRLVRMAAVFRIIDGMDKQLARAGDAIEVCMKAEAILADLPHLWQRVVRLEQAISRLAPRAGEAANEILRRIVGIYKEKESVGSGKSKPEGGPVRECRGYGCEGCDTGCLSPHDPPEDTEYSILCRSLSISEEWMRYLPLAWEYLDARVRFYFTAMQPSYYHSDLLLAMPRITHRVEDGVRYIVIDYPENKDAAGARSRLEETWKSIRSWVTANLPEDAPENKIAEIAADNGLQSPERVVQALRDEYCAKNNSEVAHILNQAGLILQYRYKGEPVRCWQARGIEP